MDLIKKKIGYSYIVKKNKNKEQSLSSRPVGNPQHVVRVCQG